MELSFLICPETPDEKVLETIFENMPYGRSAVVMLNFERNEIEENGALWYIGKIKDRLDRWHSVGMRGTIVWPIEASKIRIGEVFHL